MSQLRRLATPFSGKWVQKAPQGKYGDYVSHSTINERLLRDLGPFSFELVEVVRGYAPQIDTKKVTYPARENAVVGVVARLTAVVDGREVRIEEAGSEENPAMHNDGENVKTALSDALKRCAMRLGVGLHLWSGDLYFLDQALDKEEPKPAPERPALRASAGDLGEPDAEAQEAEGEFPPDPPEDLFDEPTPEPEPEVEARSDLATSKQLGKIGFITRNHHLSREEAHAFISWFVKRPLSSSKELTKREASKLIEAEGEWADLLARFAGDPDSEEVEAA